MALGSGQGFGQAQVCSKKDSIKTWVFYLLVKCFVPCTPERQGKLTWAVKPKMHTFEHQLLEVKRTCDLVAMQTSFYFQANLKIQ